MLLLLALCAGAPVHGRNISDKKILHIAHVNDVHNRIEETSTSSGDCAPSQAAKGLCLGGWARIATAVSAARKEAAGEKSPFLFLDVGDEFDGTLWDVVYRGQATATVQNMVGPDAMTLGNHEFSFPASVLRAYLQKLKAPMLGACNVNTTGEPLLDGLIKRWSLFNAGGYKVAVMGWITPDTAILELNSGNVTFNDVIPSVKACIADLKRAHGDVDLIIGMSHTGYTSDLETARQIPELDLILGGHSHTFLDTPNNTGPIFDNTKGASAADCVAKGACDQPAGLFPTMVETKLCRWAGKERACMPKRIPVVQAYYASKYMGHLKIDLVTKALVYSRPVLLGGSHSSNPVTKDPNVTRVIESMRGPVTALGAKVAGASPVRLVGGGPGRQMETNFGDYLSSLLVRAGRGLRRFEETYGAVDIGLVTGGGIRADIEMGNITYGDVMTALPFGNTMAIKSATGAQIKAALANGISQLADNAGRFPQVAGLRLLHRGTKLVAAKLLSSDGTTSEINDTAIYNIVSTSYLLSGGDGYAMFKARPYLYPSGDTMDAVVTNDLNASWPQPVIVPDPTQERRVINCAAEYVDCSNAKVYGPCCTD